MLYKKEKGVAFLVLIGVLSVMIVLVFGLLLLLKFEDRSAFNFKRSVQATYIAEAGFEHAKSLLRKDKSETPIDAYTEDWRVVFEGDEVDNDGDGLKDSRWIDFFDISGNLIGRYAVLIKDENSKININTAGLSQDKGITTEEISLIKFLEALNKFTYSKEPLDNLETKAQAIYQHRPYLTLSQIVNLDEIDSRTYRKLKNVTSIYSKDFNTAISGGLKFCINEIGTEELYQLFKTNSVNNAAQLAVNVVDFYDTNLNQSYIRKGGKGYYGCEAVKINEIMVKPSFFFEVENEGPKGGWEFVGDHYQTGEFEASAMWRWQEIRNGVYYLRVFADGAGQIVGDVTVGGQTQKSMVDGELFDVPITIEGGIFIINIQNNEEQQDGNPITCYFKSVKLSQEPDGEFIELVNMSNQTVDLGGFTISGSGLAGTINSLTIPRGTLMGAKEFFVLAVDAFDEQEGIEDNKISFKDIWHKEFGVVNLEADHCLEPDSECLLNEGGVLFLQDPPGHIVDRVEFLSEQIEDYISLEKDDPAYVEDSTGDSICDFWNLSLDSDGATPGEENQNANMGIHSALDSLFRNSAFERAGEILDVSFSKNRWQNFPLEDAAKIIDKICIESLRCQAKDHLVEGTGWTLEGEQYRSQEALDAGKWNWQVQNGIYFLTVYGEEGEALSVSVDGEDFFEFVPDDKGRINYGMVEIDDNTLNLFLINKSPTQVAHFKYAVLSPKLTIEGRANVNTATKALLLSLPGIDEETSSRLIEGRPFGNQNDLKRGLGDLLPTDVLDSNETLKVEKFKKISNLATTKSNIFEIIVTGQRWFRGKVVGEKRLRTVFER